MSKQRAQIIGAGIGGLTAAHALQHKGWQVTVAERAEAFAQIGAGIQLSPNATRVLDTLGLLPAIRAQAFEPEAASIRDGRSGATLLYAPLRGLCERLYGAPYLHIFRPRLHAALARGLDIEMGREVVAPCEGADLSVGADGLWSKMQGHVLGADSTAPPRFTGQVAWRGMVAVGPALRALIPPHACVWVGTGQHLVTYYIDANTLNFVAVTEQEDWQAEGWNLPGDVGALQARFAHWHAAPKALLAACETVQRWALFDRPALPNWHRGRVALLGDAAHPTLPFLAQGAALAIEDAAALAEHCPADAKPDLAGYEAARKPRATAMQGWARANARLYHQTRALDRLKLQLSRAAFRGPQAHALFWRIFRG